MLGIALGSFAEGFAGGIEMGQKLHEIRKQRKLDTGLEEATASGTAEYESKVAAGEEKADDPNAALAYIVPKVSHTYMLNGHPEVAAQWADWMETNNAKRGSKLFMKGLSKLQTGDTQAGIDSMLEAANLSGYGPDGKVTAAEYYDEEAGAVTGYRFSFEGPDGEPMTKNVAVDDVAQFLAGIANPQSAFEMDQANKAARSKADLEVETHGRKKKLEKELGVGTGAMTQAQYQNAIQEEVKQLNDRKLTGTDPELEEATAEEIEQKARETVDARLGQGGGATAGPQVTVDPETGEQVQPPAVETPATDSTQPPPADEEVPADEDLGVGTGEGTGGTPVSSAAPVQQAPQVAGINAPTPAAQASEMAPDQQQAYITQASQLMRQGGNAQQIAQTLIKAGVSPDKWPQDLQLAARSAQLGVA